MKYGFYYRDVHNALEYNTCPHCKSVYLTPDSPTNNQEQTFEDIFVSMDEKKKKNRTRLERCIHCNKKAYLYNYPPSTYQSKRIFPKPIYLSHTVTQDYKRIQLSIQGLIYTAFKGRVQAFTYMTRIVFNIRTGRVTLLQPIGKDGKKLDKIFGPLPPMQNFTFGSFVSSRYDLDFTNLKDIDLVKEFGEDLFPMLVAGLQTKFPYVKGDHFDECFDRPKGKKKVVVLHDHGLTSREIFSSITLRFRFHDLSVRLSKSFTSTMIAHKNPRRIASKIPFGSSRQVSEFFKLFYQNNIPKSLKPLAMTSIKYSEIIPNMNFLHSFANRAKLIEKSVMSVYDVNKLRSFYIFYMPFLKEKHKNNYKDEVKLHQYCETIFTNRIIETPLHIAFDIESNYSRIIAIKPGLKDSLIDTSICLHNLHDDLYKTYDSLRYVPVEIDYSEEELKMNTVLDGYTFSLVPDTAYMRKIGKEMNICVGSYSDSAVKKQLNIVLVSSEQNEFECCLELTGDSFAIKQAKIKYNSCPEGELLEAIEKWTKENNVLHLTADLYRDDSDYYYDVVHPASNKKLQERREALESAEELKIAN